MVSEASVIGMLLDGHDLYAVISGSLYTRQDIILEFYVSTHTLTLLSHAHMTLVYEQRVFLGFEIPVTETVLLLGIPHLG